MASDGRAPQLGGLFFAFLSERAKQWLASSSRETRGSSELIGWILFIVGRTEGRGLGAATCRRARAKSARNAGSADATAARPLSSAR